MKASKTKKLAGGLAVAMVSLGCLGLAGVANAAAPKVVGGTSGSSSSSSLPSGAITGAQTVTFNVSKAQGETLANHPLEYVQIGAYMPHGTTSFSVESMPDVSSAIASFATAPASSGGLLEAFPNASYSSSDGDPLNWLLTGNVGDSYIGTDPTGQVGNQEFQPQDYAVRLLANYLASDSAVTGLLQKCRTSPVSTSADGFQEETWTAAPGVYLVIDAASGNASMPIILSTKPGGSFQVPASMQYIITNKVSLKTQDPQTAPVKNFVVDGKVADGNDGNSIMNVTTGTAGLTEFQVAGDFPTFIHYPSYTYTFTDDPSLGMTLQVAGGKGVEVAGIPLSTILAQGKGADAAYVTVESAGGSKPVTYTASNLSSMPNVTGGTGAEFEVTLHLPAMQYILANGKQTTTTVGDAINSSGFARQNVQNPAYDFSSDATGNTMQGQESNGKTGQESWTGQATGELFGLTYSGYLQSQAPYAAGSKTQVEATNTAYTDNNGSGSLASNDLSLESNGAYNSGIGSDGTSKGLSPVPAGHITKDGSTTGSTTKDGTPYAGTSGAGLNWVKVWSNGSVAQEAEFEVQNSSGEYLQPAYSGWTWTAKQSANTEFGAVSGSDAPADSQGGLFEFAGLGAGTYTVTEVKAAKGADQNLKPSFTVTLASDGVETVDGSGAGALNLVNNTPNGTPFNSKEFNTVENLKTLAQLPFTGGAGILAGTIAAVVIFGAAGIALVVWKKKKAERE